jgi:glucuronoarabinoxylan endo-1,4-beta-xylanase
MKRIRNFYINQLLLFLSHFKLNMKPMKQNITTWIFLLLISIPLSRINAQTVETTIELKTQETHQTITGFGAALAYYEGWLTAHPNRSQIYDIIFKELSLDILRLRNAYGYDPGMVTRAKQFVDAAEKSLGHPIDVLVSSWGPPASYKSNNDRKNGGTLKYTVNNGKVEFSYDAFANWWTESLDNYKANGIFPKYISIQNEPDFSATWESCLFKPSELINNTDTIAGYNKALNAVYDSVVQRENPPLLIGPECVGIGYNAVENYVNVLDRNKIHAIAHHLYHGAESGTVKDDPFTSSNYAKVGKYRPEIPKFQTEYSRAEWFVLAGMIFQSLEQENVSAYLYWDLIWSEGGLVNLHFPWDQSRWENSVGYNRTKDFYVFKHYSAYIHPGWQRIGTSVNSGNIRSTAFISSTADSAAMVLINRSDTDTLKIKVDVPGYQIEKATAYSTTEDSDFVTTDYLTDTLFVVPPKSINTLDLRLAKINTGVLENSIKINGKFGLNLYPNPFTTHSQIEFSTNESGHFSLGVFDLSGKKVSDLDLGYFPAGKYQFAFKRNNLKSGFYIYRLSNATGESTSGRMLIKD